MRQNDQELYHRVVLLVPSVCGVFLFFQNTALATSLPSDTPIPLIFKQKSFIRVAGTWYLPGACVCLFVCQIFLGTSIPVYLSV